MEENKNRNELTKEMIAWLHQSTKELAETPNKPLEVHEQIRKNCETALACYTNMWG